MRQSFGVPALDSRLIAGAPGYRARRHPTSLRIALGHLSVAGSLPLQERPP